MRILIAVRDSKEHPGRAEGLIGCLLVLMYLSVQLAHAEPPSVTLSVDTEQVGLNDTFSMTVSVSGVDLHDLKVAGLQNFETAGTSSGSSFSIVNGRISSSQQRTFQLRPKRTGRFILGPASITSGGKTYRSQSAQITVVSGGGRHVAPPATTPSFPMPGDESDVAVSDVIVRLVASPERVYVNQQVTLTFELYYRADIGDANYSPSETTGFLAMKLPRPETSRTVIKGQTYVVEKIPTALFPMQSGKFTLGPATLTFTTGFFGGTQTRKTNTVTIEVSDLPKAGRPVGFTGAVGNFRVDAHLDRTQVKNGEAATLIATVTGTGNISSIQKLIIPQIGGLRVLQGAQKEDISYHGMKIAGTKTFEYVLIPEREGLSSLGRMSLPIFDPATGKYTVARSQPLTLRVLPGQDARVPTGLPADITIPQSARLLRQDLRYIKGDRSSLAVAAASSWDRPLFAGLHGLCILLLVVARVYAGRVERFQKDETLQRTVRGSRAAKRWLREAESLCRKGENAEFYTALSRALTEYLSARLNIPVAAVSADSVAQHLTAVSAPEASIRKVSECLRRAELARFAPLAGGEEDRASRLLLARECIKELEQVFRDAR